MPSAVSAVAPARANISEQAYQHLRSMILEGELTPGTIVAERRLAEALSASRTPLRAAISRLEGEGLLERQLNGSIVIRSVSIDELLQILFVRHLLESEAAGLASGKLDPDQLALLMDQSRELASGENTDFEAFWRHDDALHEAIALASGMAPLHELVGDLRRKARMCNLAKMPQSFKEQGEEHLAILRAIEAGDAKAARRAMTKHFAKVRGRLLRWLSGP